MTININLEALIAAVRKLAEEHPSEVYTRPEGCRYSEGKCGPGEGCLIGQAAKLSNPELYAIMVEVDKVEACTITRLLFSYLSCPSLEQKNQIVWLNRVQANQDSQRAWSDCVKLTDGGVF